MEDRNITILRALEKLLAKGEIYRATRVLNTVPAPDAAEIIERLPEEEQQRLFERWDPNHSAEALLEMEESDQVDIAEGLSLNTIAEILSEMPADDAADLLGALPYDRRHRILSAMEPEATREVETLLAHSKDTAGGRMTTKVMVLSKEMKAAEAIEYLREKSPSSDIVYYLFLVDDDYRLVGIISLRDLIISSPDTTLKEIMNTKVHFGHVSADQEEIARIMRKYDLLALPVVNDFHQLVGMITADDIMDVIQEEATEDMYHMVGLSSQERLATPVFLSLRRRLPWLYVNLLTAVFAGWVVSMFEATIAKMAVLAAFMPVVANQGGVGGSQVATIIVRSMALGEVDRETARQALFKELFLGVLNGIAIGSAVALIAFLWKGIPLLGVVVGLAMFLNLIAAALAGWVVPLGLKSAGVDPAIASSIFVTVVTDVCGFLFFLGLATFFLRWLL